MTDSPICPTCQQPIGLRDPVYFRPDRQTMEHLRCRVPWRDIPPELDESANPVYGPMA
jgi:hypothetical protein